MADVLKLREVVDIVGEIIEPGNIIALSRSGRNTKSLEIGIVSKIVKSRLYLFKKSFIFRHQIDKSIKYPHPNAYDIVKTIVVPNIEYTILSRDKQQDHLVLLKNPLFCLENKSIAALLEIMDYAKVENLLPQDYVLGKSIIIREN